MDRQPEPEYMDDPAEAAAYAAADFSDVNAAFVARLLELTPHLDQTSAHAIDLGTGPGDIAMRVARLRPHWRVLGVDAAQPMLAIARKTAHELTNASFSQRDATATDLPAGSFDLIFSNSLLHHLPNPLPLWREIARLIRPGGVVFLRDLLRPGNADDARRIVQTYAGTESKLLQEEFYRSLLAAFTIDEIRQQLAAVGGQQQQQQFETFQVQRSSDRHVDVFGRFWPKT